jgi:hypothetical protein
MDKLREKLKKIFTLKRVLFSSILLFVSLIWFKYIAGIILVVIFIPITIFVIRYSRFIPHVTADCNLAFSCLMAFAFGPVIGAIYACVAGMISLVVNSHVKLAALASIALAAIGSIVCSVLGSAFNMGFNQAFFIAVIVRTGIAFPLYTTLGTDPLENFTHQTSQALVNMIIYMPLMALIYGLFGPYL